MTAPKGHQTFRKHDYKCTECGTKTDKEDLFTRRVQFLSLGFKPQLIKSRVTAWLCITCLKKDPDYIRDMYTESPGVKAHMGDKQVG